MRKLILRTNYCLGDIVVMTGAVRDLHRCYPGKFITDVRTPCGELWNHNPYLTHLEVDDPEVETLDLDSDLTGWSGQVPYHFLEGFVDDLNRQLGLSIRCTEFKGDLHLSRAEKRQPGVVAQLAGRPMPIPYWLLFAGGRHELQAKWWDTDRFQEVVDHFRGRLQFVQAGSAGDYHPKLSGTIDLRGQSSVRQLLQLMYHAQGVLCGVTGPMHLAAAVESPEGPHHPRPCVVIAGGRESPHWEAYPHHQFIHTIGALPCCRSAGCWKTRALPLGDGEQGDDPDRLCVNVRGILPRCMDLITTSQVVDRIELYFQGGARRFLNPAERRAGAAAIAKTARNPVDEALMPLGSARYECERFLRGLDAGAPSVSATAGVLICVHASTELAEAWASVHLLRHLGCDLPVEIWHRAAFVLTAAVRQEWALLGVTLRPALALASETALLPHALKHSAIGRILFWTAGMVPVKNPASWLQSTAWLQHGLVAWDDPSAQAIPERAWPLSGLPVANAVPIGTAVLFVDQACCWRALALWEWFEKQAHVYHPVSHRGRDLAHLAFLKAGVTVARPAQRKRNDLALHGFSGEIIFERLIHLLSPRRKDAGAKRAARLASVVRKATGRWHALHKTEPAQTQTRASGPTRNWPDDLTPLSPRDRADPFTIVTLFEEKRARVGRITAGVMREYARRLGYGFLCHQALLDRTRPLAWNKLAAARNALADQRSGSILWIDAGAMPMNFQIAAREFLPAGRDLALAANPSGPAASLFVARHSDWSLSFLDAAAFLQEANHHAAGRSGRERDAMGQLFESFPGISEHVLLLDGRGFDSALSTFQQGDFLLHVGNRGRHESEMVLRRAREWIVE